MVKAMKENKNYLFNSTLQLGGTFDSFSQLSAPLTLLICLLIFFYPNNPTVVCNRASVCGTTEVRGFIYSTDHDKSENDEKSAAPLTTLTTENESRNDGTAAEVYH